MLFLCLNSFLITYYNVITLGSNEGKAALKAEAMPLIEQIVGDNIRKFYYPI